MRDARDSDRDIWGEPLPLKDRIARRIKRLDRFSVGLVTGWLLTTAAIVILKALGLDD